MAKKTKHPAQLSFTRSHSASVFPFFEFNNSEKPLFELSETADLAPLRVVREGIRGSKSAASTVEAEHGEANLQRIDFARLSHSADTVLIDGSILVTPKSLRAHTCASKESADAETFRVDHADFLDAFKAAGGYHALAQRYVMNLLNGRILFENQLGSNIRCAVRIDDLTVEINRDRDLQRAGSLSVEDIKSEELRKQVLAVVDVYADALSGKYDSLLVQVRAAATFARGQDVYPSQEFLGAPQEKGEGRVLAVADRSDIRQAAFHGRKVANALRTIDNWYPGGGRPLPVEPFAPDQSTQVAKRKDTSTFYSLLPLLPSLTEALREGKLPENALYVAAVFIRGGVFSKKEAGGGDSEKMDSTSDTGELAS